MVAVIGLSRNVYIFPAIILTISSKITRSAIGIADSWLQSHLAAHRYRCPSRPRRPSGKVCKFVEIKSPIADVRVQYKAIGSVRALHRQRPWPTLCIFAVACDHEPNMPRTISGFSTHHLHQVTDQKCSHCGLLMIIGNVNVYNVHRLIVYRRFRFHVVNNLTKVQEIHSSRQQKGLKNTQMRSTQIRYVVKSTYLIVDPFFGCNNNIELLGAVLELLRLLFDASIPVEHMQEAILGITVEHKAHIKYSNSNDCQHNATNDSRHWTRPFGTYYCLSLAARSV